MRLRARARASLPEEEEEEEDDIGSDGSRESHGERRGSSEILAVANHEILAEPPSWLGNDFRDKIHELEKKTFVSTKRKKITMNFFFFGKLSLKEKKTNTTPLAP